MALPLAIIAGVQAGAGLYGAYQESQAIRNKAEFDANQLQFSAAIGQLQAADAERRGELAANAVRRKAKQIVGSQRAALAAQGIALDSGSAADIQEEALAMSEHDMNMIKNNAWREAWGLKAQSMDYLSEARFTKLAGENAARNTLLIGGINAATKLGSAAYEAGAFKGSSAKAAGSSYSPNLSSQLQQPSLGSSYAASHQRVRYGL